MVYISGPMTGYIDFNRSSFESAESFLVSIGYRCFSPHRAPKMNTWTEYMKYDISRLLECDTIVMLEGHRESKGASLEKAIAEALGYRVFYLLTSNAVPLLADSE